MTDHAIPLRGAAGEVFSTVAAAGPSGTTTSLACYFKKGSSVTWQWGLNGDNSYYSLHGTWITTPHTGLTKFVTNASQAELIAAANKSIQYYKLAGYTIECVLAADSSVGYNYPIISAGTQLYPKY